MAAAGFESEPESTEPLGLFGSLGERVFSDFLTPRVVKQLRDSYSITTIEEVVSLAFVANKLNKPLLSKVGLEDSAAESALAFMSATPEGQATLDKWERLSQIEYSKGFKLDPAAEPASPFEAPAPSGEPCLSLINAYMPDIRNQQDRGTCVSFATTSCLEYLLNSSQNLEASSRIDLSEQFMYWNMVEQSGQHSLRAACPLIPTDGICLESTWVYSGTEIPGNDSQGPAPSGAAAEAQGFRCSSANQIGPRDVDAIKDELKANRPVCIGIPVYDSWYESPVVRQTGNIGVPIAGEVPQPSGHAITLVGFCDDDQFAGGGYFVVRNSWDSLWGMDCPYGSGYGTIPYRYISMFNWDAWSLS